MARFKGWIKGQKGEVSRLGSSRSGLRADINGWNLGIEIFASVDDRGEDVFTIFKTGGSNGSSKQLLCTINSREAAMNDLLKGIYCG